MTETDVERRTRIVRSCTRRLNGGPMPTPAERLAQLAAHPAAQGLGDMYGDGGPVAVLETRVADLLGAEAALFFPTGTMAQQAALRIHGTTVALHPQSHPEVHERHAYSTLSGLRAVWPTRAPRLPAPAEIAACEPFDTLMLELPLRDPGFLLPTWDELTATVAAARDRGARVHLDGARLWESTVHLGHSLAEIAALADSVYVSFYKTLGGISGAALTGSAGFVAEARAWRHRYGGNLFQQWPAALSALVGLDTELPRLEEYVAHAKVVAGALAGHATVHPAVPHTHQFQVWLPYPAEAVNAAALAHAEETGEWVLGFLWDAGTPGWSMTELTVAGPALEWTADEVAAGVKALLSRLT
ncbi:beta-eliminating lyase-related protein [Longispora sp. K20-0274]|uniref:threonine aldolase family protein n=1 Tax=Longispora sp. K20-0274 TaxID=3088255 RepID=UPI00399C2738